MNTRAQSAQTSSYTILASVASAVLLIFSVFAGVVNLHSADPSFRGILKMIGSNPLYWFIFFLCFAFPVTVYLLLNTYSKQSGSLQKALEEGTNRLNEINRFTNQLIREELDAELILSGEKDELGESMLTLRNTLRNSRDNNLRIRQEEEKRNWIAEGLAHISEILRNNLNDLSQLSYFVIRDLTRYIGAVQGGFYTLDDSDSSARQFVLTSFIAYDRKKFSDQRIKWGDGLIGTCAMEQKTIHLKHVPQEYISVTSGLGDARPEAVLIVPMIFEGKVFGILEFASLKPFAEDHVALVENAAESVASTLSAVKANLETSRLLEESKAQTLALTSQEEEMRQNLEELQATQEEATRQSERFRSLENSVNRHIMMAEFTIQGKLQFANPLFINRFEFESDLTFEGKTLPGFIHDDMRQVISVQFREVTESEKPWYGIVRHITRGGKDLWALASFSCHFNEEGIAEKVVYLGMDATEEKSRQLVAESIQASFIQSGLFVQFDINGNITECNPRFTREFGYSQQELKNLVASDLIDPNEAEAFARKWESLLNSNIAWSGMLKTRSSDGRTMWLTGTLTPLQNETHETDRVIWTALDQSREKELEVSVKEMGETIKKQEKLLKDSERDLSARLRETKAEMLKLTKELERANLLQEKILEDCPEAIVVTGQDNRIRYFNKSAESLWAIDRTQVIQHDVSLLFSEKQMEEDELVESFTRPGDFKIIGKLRKMKILDKKGVEKPVMMVISRTRIENENHYTAFLQKTDK